MKHPQKPGTTPLCDSAATKFPTMLLPALLWEGLARQIEEDLTEARQQIAALQSPAPKPPGDAREAFEAWGRTHKTPEQGWWFRQLDGGGYSAHEPDIAWTGWKACMAWQAATVQASEPSAAAAEVRESAPINLAGDTVKAAYLFNKTLPAGTLLYPAAPARAVEPLTDEQRAAIMKRWHGRNWTAGDIIDAVESHYLGITTTPAAKAGKDGGV